MDELKARAIFIVWIFRDFKKLPYHQLVEGGKITYIVEEVELWFKNNRV